MQILLDHISSSIIAGIVFVILLGLQWRVSETTVDRTILYMGKKNTLNLGEIIERDLENAGFGILPGEDGILEHRNVAFGSVVYTESLVFESSDNAGNPVTVRYTVAVEDTITINGVVAPLLSLTREEDSGTGFTNAGGSSATLTDFDVDLLNTQNVGTTRTTARKLRVRFKSALLPMNWKDSNMVRNNDGLNELLWGMTVEPPGLKLQGYQG